jgi:hypothetical protein
MNIAKRIIPKEGLLKSQTSSSCLIEASSILAML